MSTRVDVFFVLLQLNSPVNVKLLVNVPNTYQNMFSISPQFPYKCLNVRRSENANGKMANTYVNMIAIHTCHWNGPKIAR